MSPPGVRIPLSPPSFIYSLKSPEIQGFFSAHRGTCRGTQQTAGAHVFLQVNIFKVFSISLKARNILHTHNVIFNCEPNPVIMKAYFFLSKKNTNKAGKCPVVCRVASRAGERLDFRTGIFIAPEHWDTKRGMPVNNAAEAFTLLTQLLNDVYKIISDCKRDGKPTVYEVVRLHKENGQPLPTTTARIAELLIADYKTGTDTTLKLSIVAAQFDEHMRRPNPASVTHISLQEFERRMKQAGFAATTIGKKFEFLKRIYTYAAAKRYISINPFALFKMPPCPKLEPVQLSAEELQRVAAYTFASTRLNRVKDLFLFQCYTGLSYSDLFEFSADNIDYSPGAAYLKGKRNKTNEIYFLPWCEEAKALADKYNYRFEPITNQKYNSYLKEIAAITGIDKKLSTHVGRKTFAQRMIDKGYSAEAVSRMVGHASFNMTQKHYARIGEQRIVNETLKMAG